jgi:hypothetical protein
LDPYESFNIEGKYANSWLRMNWWILLIGTLLVIGAIIGGIYGIRELNKKDKKLGLSLLVGLGTGIGLWMVLGISMYILTILSSIYYMNIVGMLVMMMTVIIGLVLLIAPSILVGLKYGLNNGIYCFLTTIGTLFMLMAISLIVIFSFLPTSASIFYF